MHHEIRRIGFDHLCSLRFAYDMALQIGQFLRGVDEVPRTISAPSFALAIAEKYGAPV
jgi:hypothetical protein